MAYEVFISYSSVDADAAEAVRAGLEDAGIGCWFAPRDALPGDRYQGSIIRAIRQCRAVVFLLSQNSNGSAHVFRELHAASEARKPIVPVRLDGVQPGDDMYYYLAPLHWLDAQKPPLRQHVARLIEVVKPHITDAPAAAVQDVMRANGMTPVRPATAAQPASERGPLRRRAGILRRRTWAVAAGAVVVVVSAFSATRWGFTEGGPESPAVLETGTDPGVLPGDADGGTSAVTSPPSSAAVPSAANAGRPAAEPTGTLTGGGRAPGGSALHETPQRVGGMPPEVAKLDAAAREAASKSMERGVAAPPPPPPPLSQARGDSIAADAVAQHKRLLGSALPVLSREAPSREELGRARANALTVYQSEHVVQEDKALAAYIIGSVARLRGELDECVRWLGYAVNIRPTDMTYSEGLRMCQAGD